MTPHFAAGTRRSSVTSESWLFIGGDLTIDPKREYVIVTGVANGGDVPQRLYMEGWGEYVEIKFTGLPIPTSAGAYQGLCAAEDAAVLGSLNNLVDGELFGIALSSGTLVSTDPSCKKSRTGNGVEFTFNLTHNPFM